MSGVALALGGGAALGWAHIGVLRVLAEERVRVRAIAGTSIGALVGLCAAADRLDVLEEIARGATARRMLGYLDPHWGRGAWLGGRRIARELERHFGARTFADLALPLAMVATDLDTAEEVRLTAGPVVAAATASMALPGLFPAVRQDGRRLIDGGMVAVVPVAAARALAPGLPVVAVDLMGDYAGHVRATHAGPPGALATLRSAFLIMLVRQQELAEARDPAEVRIVPAIGHLSTGDFARADELIAHGAAAARAALPKIRAVLHDCL